MDHSAKTKNLFQKKWNFDMFLRLEISNPGVFDSVEISRPKFGIFPLIFVPAEKINCILGHSNVYA